MKKYSLIFSLLVTIIAVLFPTTASAQQPGNEYAIFNWQNNGDFNAFLNCDVDSITYSKIDLDSVKHPNVVVQEIWTPDSVYRIPIAAIDSVAFRAPEPVLKSGIFHITEWHFPYVTDVNDSTALTITFNASMPSDSLPSVGQVVITDVYDGLLENGFAGRVINIVRTGNSVLVECEDVALDDVYDLLVCVGKSESFIDEDSPAGAAKRTRYEKEGVLTYEIARWNTKIVDFEGENGSGNMEITVIPSINLDYAICYNVKGKENHFKCVVSPTLDCDFDSNWKLSKSVSFPKKPKDFVYVKIPTKVPGLVAKVGASYFVDFNGSAELNVKVPMRIQANAGYDSWRDNPFFVNFDGTGIRSINGVSDGNFQIKLDGSVYTGLSLNFTVFFLHEDVANAKIGLKAGPKFSASIDFSNDLTHLPSWYDFKDTKISIEPLVAQLTAGVKTLFTEQLSWESPQWSVFGSKDYYLFPNFTAPHLNAISSGLSSTALTTDISRNLIFSVTPGIGLYQNNQLKYSYFSDSTYKRQDKWNINYLQMELLNKYPVGTYTAKPIFKFFNNTIEALPTSSMQIPDTLKVDNTVNVKVNETQTVTFMGGWGDYDIFNSASSVCKASISGKKINIEGIKKGSALLTLKDKRSGESKKINVIVYETQQPPTISVNPDEHNFGTVILGNSDSITFTVNCSNVSDGVSISKSGNTGMFSVTSNTDATGNGTFTVTYNPIATGTHTMNLYVKCAYGPCDTVTVTGKCVNPTITTVPADTLEFGNVIVGQSKTLPFKITGQGLTGNLTVSSTTARFSVTPTTITPDANGTVNTTVNVTYTPTQAGGNGAYIKISGGGLAETTKVYAHGKGVVPTLTVDPTSIDFGTVLLGDSVSKTVTVTATNLNGNLTLRTTNNTRFKVNHKTSISLTPDANGAINKTVTVTYKPTQAQKNGGYLLISGDGIQQDTVKLSGVCEEAYIKVTPSTLEFGDNIAPGLSVKKSFTLTTNVPGTLSYTLAATESSVFTVPTTIKAGTNTVKFQSSEAGGYSGVINIQDTKYGAKASVDMSARVVPTITVSPTSHDFGTVVKGYTATKEFTVSTLGFTSAMSLEMASSNSNFKLNKSKLGASGGSFVVTYKPTATGTHTATITISSVGPGEVVSKTISLTGKCEDGYITVTPTKLEFGDNIAPGHAVNKSFTLTTNVPGTLSYTLAATESGVFTVPTTIKAGTNTVKFQSSEAGGYSGVINIQDPISGATASVNMSARVVPQITVSPTSHDFGTVVKGYTATKEFTVSTLGFTNAMSLEMASSNSNFKLSKSTLGASGGSFIVTYKPTATGTHSATITISSVGPGGSVSKTISLTGKCEAGYITVTPTKLEFGDNIAPGHAVNKSFTLTTNVSGTLSYTLSATEPSVFTVPTTIKAGTNTVKFQSSEAGGYSGVINIQDPISGATASVNMSARVVPAISVSPTSHDFGTVVKGYTATKEFSVSTLGFTSAMSLEMASNNSNFKLNKSKLGSSGGSFVVTYQPTAVGTHTATITISGGGVSKTISLTGKCEAGYITVTPTTLEFGNNIAPGHAVNKSFTLTTNVPGTLSYTLSATESGVFTVPTTIKAGTNTVKFQSSESGGYSGVINIQDTKSGATASVNLNARVAAPIITVNPTSLSFGGTPVNSSRQETFTVTGSGLTGNLNVSSSSTIYSVSPSTITPDANGTVNKQVTVTFSPKIVKSYSGTVTVSGGGAADKTVSLTGKGIEETVI